MDSFFKIDNYSKMKFSLEIGPATELETLPSVEDVYITLLPGENYLETTKKAGDLFKKGFNPVPHFPARSILDEAQLNDYVSRCKDLGVGKVLFLAREGMFLKRLYLNRNAMQSN